jgi:hypothetical protein
MFWERIIALLIMLAGAAIFFWREQLADMLPDTPTMRLLLSVGGPMVVVIQVFRIVRRRNNSKAEKEVRKDR